MNKGFKRVISVASIAAFVLGMQSPVFGSSANLNHNGKGAGLSKDNGRKWSVVESGEINYVANRDGPTLGYSGNSGVDYIIRNGYAFKDLNKNNKLDDYEDWRLSVKERAEDLASKMSVEEISGLMLYSSHQRIDSAELTEAQRSYIVNDNLRHVLFTSVASPETAAQWNNNAQALAEGLGLGIPLNNSSDPRHGSDSSAEYNAGAGGDI